MCFLLEEALSGQRDQPAHQTGNGGRSDPGDGDILEYAEVIVAKEHSVHLQLHGDPHDKNSPEIIYWRSRLENIVSTFDSEMKVYDFTLKKNEDGTVAELDFHLLIPHRYKMSENEIQEKIQQKTAEYQSNIKLEITKQ